MSNINAINKVLAFYDRVLMEEYVYGDYPTAEFVKVAKEYGVAFAVEDLLGSYTDSEGGEADRKWDYFEDIVDDIKSAWWAY